MRDAHSSKIARLLHTLFRGVIGRASIAGVVAQHALSLSPAVIPPWDRRRGVGADSVVKWDWFWCQVQRRGLEDGMLLRWKGRSPASSVNIHAAANFIDTREETDWACDITDVDAIFASKSDLAQFKDLDEFAETNCRDLIEDVSIAALERNVSHNEIRILSSTYRGDYLKRWAWDGRLFLMNNGGSHHFAAARWLAKRLGQPIPIRSTLYTVSVRRSAVSDLLTEYEILAFGRDDSVAFSCGLHDALLDSGAPFLKHHLPSVLGGAEIILIERNHRCSQRVIRTLHEQGITSLTPLLKQIAQV